MKKTLISAVAGLAVIGTATALPSPKDRRTMCEQKTDYVWVEKNNECVPVNPCAKDVDEAIQNAYCNRIFKQVQLGNMDQGKKLVDAYLKQKSMTGDYVGNRHRDTSVFGQDYLPYKTSDNGYMVFEFDDLSDMTKNDIKEGALRGACNVFNTSIESVGCWGHKCRCSFIKTEEDCSKAADLAFDVSGYVVYPQFVDEDAPLVDNNPESMTHFTYCVLSVEH